MNTLLPKLINAETLRAAGRCPVLPFRIALADGRELVVQRLLRVLPGKRVVGEALLDGQRVLAKLFIAKASARHWQQEQSGIEALRAATIPTPDLLAATPLAGGGHALLTRFLEPAASLAEVWARVADGVPGTPPAVAVLFPALALLRQMHMAGLVQDDLHMGNFLSCEGVLFVIDGDAVRSLSAGKPLAMPEAVRNLAILLAQLPAAWDLHWPVMLQAYAEGDDAGPLLDLLQKEVAAVRAWRLNDLLAKSVRDCTLFSVEKGFGRFVAVLRSEREALSSVLASPDVVMAQGQLLKDGGTCTVARAELPARTIVIKRYNLKSVGHAVSRLWRPSRAWHSWREGHRLQFYGISTPTPLALLEERIGPLRSRAFLVNAYCPGISLMAYLAPDMEPPGDMAQALISLFETLYRLCISHGDLKATNLLWHEGRVWLIDLDAMKQHRSDKAFSQAWRRDRARLLRNWPASSLLCQWLDANLPVDIELE